MRYSELVRKLRRSGVEFYRQARGSHEVWWRPIKEGEFRAYYERRHRWETVSPYLYGVGTGGGEAV
ncbi:MAG: hypothetical protein HW393_636, partial [Dehalococcoidia bacterium]|nr:hypothetical protein [Dehalococcoidia bacterium]